MLDENGVRYPLTRGERRELDVLRVACENGGGDEADVELEAYEARLLAKYAPDEIAPG
jgi:hypothetical protein